MIWKITLILSLFYVYIWIKLKDMHILYSKYIAQFTCVCGMVLHACSLHPIMNVIVFIWMILMLTLTRTHLYIISFTILYATVYAFHILHRCILEFSCCVVAIQIFGWTHYIILWWTLLLYDTHAHTYREQIIKYFLFMFKNRMDRWMLQINYSIYWWKT